MTTETATPAKDRAQIALRLPSDVEQAISDFLANASPAMLAKITGSTMLGTGRPHKNQYDAFTAYAIRLALAKGEPATRAFGNKIDEFIDGVTTANLAAYEADPAEWWKLTAIGSSMLRDAGHNPNSVKRWLDENGDRIAEHHAAVGIADPANHNRKAGKARKAVAQ